MGGFQVVAHPATGSTIRNKAGHRKVAIEGEQATGRDAEQQPWCSPPSTSLGSHYHQTGAPSRKQARGDGASQQPHETEQVPRH